MPGGRVERSAVESVPSFASPQAVTANQEETGLPSDAAKDLELEEDDDENFENGGLC